MCPVMYHANGFRPRRPKRIVASLNRLFHWKVRFQSQQTSNWKARVKKQDINGGGHIRGLKPTVRNELRC